MKSKKLLTIILVLLVTVSYAQEIQSWGYNPNQPTVNDTITVHVFSTFLNGPCLLDSATVRDSANFIIVDFYHCLGPSSGTCLAYDTAKIPPHPLGSYFISVFEHYDTGSCFLGTYPYYYSFAHVQVGPSGINEANLCKEKIGIDAAASSIRIDYPAGCATGEKEISLYNVSGKLMHRSMLKTFPSAVAFKQPKGVYFYELKGRESQPHFGKIHLTQ